MPPAATACSQTAASWNQHSAPPWCAPLCRNSSGALSEAASGLGAGVATWVAVQPHVDADAGRVAQDHGVGVAARQRAGQHGLLGAGKQHQPVCCRRCCRRPAPAVPPMLSSVLAAVELCRQLGRDQTRNTVQAVPEPRAMAALIRPWSGSMTGSCWPDAGNVGGTTMFRPMPPRSRSGAVSRSGAWCRWWPRARPSARCRRRICRPPLPAEAPNAADRRAGRTEDAGDHAGVPPARQSGDRGRIDGRSSVPDPPVPTARRSLTRRSCPPEPVPPEAGCHRNRSRR